MSAIEIGGATWRPAFTDDPHPFFAEQRVPAPVSRGEAFTALLTRFPGLALGSGGPVWRHSFQLHSLKSLPVTFTPVPAAIPCRRVPV
jgi:hypothetical protein